ncbi:hypothetical protein ACFL3F_03495 [Planctomycetota bacterium]
MEAKKRTAKEIYMRYGCSTSGRWREGDYDEYRSHGISEEQESEWRKEYQKDLLDLLVSDPCNGGFVTSAYMHCVTGGAQESIDALMDILDDKQREMDSFSKMTCAKEILEFFTNEWIRGDRKERLRSLGIDLLQSVIRAPGNIDKRFREMDHLRDKLSEDRILRLASEVLADMQYEIQ